MIVIVVTLCEFLGNWILPKPCFEPPPKPAQTTPQTMSHTPPKYTPWCSPDCSPDNSSDDLQNTPESASQMLPLSQLTTQDFWSKCGPNLRPEPEARQWNIGKKCGHNVARPMSRKRPKFLASHSQIFKDSLHRKDSEPGRSGHFLAKGLATKWPNFDSTFFQFPISDFQI